MNDTTTDYIPTREDIITFNRDRMGYACPVLSSFKPLKELNGQLVLIEGNNVTVIRYDAPWALLSSIKSTYIRNRYKESNLQLKHLSWKN